MAKQIDYPADTVPMLSRDAMSTLYDLIGITNKTYGSYSIPFFIG
mgnify:CR=1 FL=1|jgi:hypothetical protein